MASHAMKVLLCSIVWWRCGTHHRSGGSFGGHQSIHREHPQPGSGFTQRKPTIKWFEEW